MRKRPEKKETRVEIETGIGCDYFIPWIKYLNAGEEIGGDELMMLRQHLAKCEHCIGMLEMSAREVVGF